jgi:hypothetical protein
MSEENGRERPHCQCSAEGQRDCPLLQGVSPTVCDKDHLTFRLRVQVIPSDNTQDTFFCFVLMKNKCGES